MPPATVAIGHVQAEIVSVGVGAVHASATVGSARGVVISATCRVVLPEREVLFAEWAIAQAVMAVVVAD